MFYLIEVVRWFIEKNELNSKCVFLAQNRPWFSIFQRKAKKYNISRVEQDKFSLNSHHKAIVATENKINVIFIPFWKLLYKENKIIQNNNMKYIMPIEYKLNIKLFCKLIFS